MMLSIVLPAYNEEESIEETVRQCFVAKQKLLDAGLYQEVEVIVVNDGSSDRTVDIVRGIEGVELVSYEINKGYGAALVTGFHAAQGDVLAFLDSDGTCDPNDFITMTQKCAKEDADMVIGMRLHTESHMPLTRRVGNIFFAKLINFLGNAHIHDSASGMRLFKKEVLDVLLPLPSGLNFTPAMSAKAILDETLKIIEVPIHYAARRGSSKLSVLRDGLRFLNSILTIAITYRPFKIFGGLGIAFLLASIHTFLLGFSVVAMIFFSLGLQLLFTGLFLNEVVLVLQPIRRLRHSLAYVFFAFLRSPRVLWTVSFASALVVVGSAWGGWGVGAVLACVVGLQCFTFGVLFQMIGVIKEVIYFRTHTTPRI